MGLLLVVCAGRIGDAAALAPSLLRVGFSASAFSGVNRNDAQAAFKAFLLSIGRKRGYELKVTTQIFEDAAAFEAALKQGSIELAIINSLSYIGMGINEVMEPLFSPLEEELFSNRYLLVTRPDGSPTKLGDLRGKKLLLMNTGRCALTSTWLEALLMGNGLGEQCKFFNRIEGVDKPSAAVLPVFFGSKQACVIDEGGFRIMKELNPQIGAKLKAVATSEPFLAHVICLARSWPELETHRQDTIQGLRELGGDPAGQQLLTLFKISRLVPFQESHLDSVRKLWTTYDQLKGKPGG